MQIEKTEDGYTLSDGLFAITILLHGAAIEKILMPNQNGVVENVVLTLANRADYGATTGYVGATIGRFAGRISNAKVDIAGHIVKLNANIAPHQLHGGFNGFDSKIWQVTHTETTDTFVSVSLSSTSKHLEEGFPGNLSVTVTYTLYANQKLTITYQALSDTDTLFNPTNHSYFNLSGNLAEKITGHTLTINSHTMLGINVADGTLNGEELTVDRTKPCLLGEILTNTPSQYLSSGGIDHTFLFDDGQEGTIELYHSKSGRALTITTDRKAVVVYTKNFLSNVMLDINRTDQQRDAICLEVQQPPIDNNGRFTKDSLLKANKPFKSVSSYQFSVKK